MSRFMSPHGIMFFPIFTFFSFFLINLSAGQITPFKMDQNKSEQTEFHQASFQRVPFEQAQFEKKQPEQEKSNQARFQQTQKQVPGPKEVHFYNVDSERKIEGTIQEIILEPRYEERLPFLMVVIKEKKTGEIYKVEVSPAWFFNYDLHKGESIKIVGSFYSQNNENFLIARELQVSGETFRLRDSRGFPNWRGGPRKGKIRRFHGK